jgi:uncharacterized membrane protein
MNAERWSSLLQTPIDIVGAALYVLIFPIYHAVYPWLIRLFPNSAAKQRFDAFRRSWIAGLLERRDVIAAAQQTRNLTMVNSLLASSSLILMGLTANVLIRGPEISSEIPELEGLGLHTAATDAKLFLLIVVFGVGYGYCMTSLRHLGHFNLVFGADPKLIEQYEGSAEDYFAALINRASNRYTLAVRCLYSASPLFLWLFDAWFFLALTLFWGIKFVCFQDFAHELKRRR